MRYRPVRRFLIGAFALCALAYIANPSLVKADLSGSEAVEKVIQQVVLPSPNKDELKAHFWPEPLKAGDVISVFRPGGQSWTLDGPTWFFWIDDVPEALFGHPTRFVFVDVASGATTVHEADSWPAVNGETLWGFPEEREDPRFIVYPKKAPEVQKR